MTAGVRHSERHHGASFESWVTTPLDAAEERTASATGKRAATHGSAFDRLVRLQRLTAQLAGTLDAERIAEVVVDHILVEVGAATAALWLVDDDHIVMLRSNGYSDDAV